LLFLVFLAVKFVKSIGTLLQVLIYWIFKARSKYGTFTCILPRIHIACIKQM